MLDKLDWIKPKYEELSMQLSLPDVAADQAGILKDVKTLCQFRETV